MVLRSLLFNLAFYVNLILWMTACLPLIWLPRPRLTVLMQGWAKSSVWLLRVVGGVRLEVRGGPLPYRGPWLVAAKHQSMFETFALLHCFADPVFILKHELTRIPLFGWWISRAGMISVRRDKGARALKEMAGVARLEARSGRQVLIFPEGTRRPPGAEPAYKAGVVLLYQQMDVPCLPVALNSGLYWPRRRWQRYPGTILVEFLDPIPAGLPRKEFLARLEATIETASDRLLVEAARAPAPPPLPESARQRLAALGEGRNA
ncbi:lysophospholipid acyltransferase family protein [Microbaculum marinum]|uniref:Lysophospholipid acyltransferase family protein n=1 Tax=Microbaculum marinum TaxID=1764581 RepID=A0AAW9S148_9HYPH